MDTSETYKELSDEASPLKPAYIVERVKWYEDPIYIKMADCEEIQGRASSPLDPGDWFYQHLKKQQPGGFQEGVIVQEIHNDYGSLVEDDADKIIWLPRQDQLQEMVKGSRHMHLLAHEFAVVFHGSHSPFDKEIPRDQFTVDSDNSMEQMWLAFIMKEKYNKVWDGEEWRKEL